MMNVLFKLEAKIGDLLNEQHHLNLPSREDFVIIPSLRRVKNHNMKCPLTICKPTDMINRAFHPCAERSRSMTYSKK
tara:strand:+ start:5692 stop:5922 length:231 start_codon:yes stop_codon:yes gene_type:complete